MAAPDRIVVRDRAGAGSVATFPAVDLPHDIWNNELAQALQEYADDAAAHQASLVSVDMTALEAEVAAMPHTVGHGLSTTGTRADVNFCIDAAFSGFATFAQAITAAAGGTLLVRSPMTVPAFTIPVGTHLKIDHLGSITKTGSGTWSILGTFEAPLRQVFIGFSAGDIVGLKHAYSEWMGGGVNGENNTTPFAIALASSKHLKLDIGTYLGVISIPSGQDCIVDGPGGNFDGTTTLKNNSVSTPLVTIPSSGGIKMHGFLLDNNNKPAHTIEAISATYLNLDDLYVKHHGNQTTAGKFGLFVDGCTGMTVGVINFLDTKVAGTSTKSTFGGHAKIFNTNIAEIGTLSGGHAGTDSTGVAFHFTTLVGGAIRNLWMDSGGGGGALFVQSCTGGFSIEKFYVELTQEAECQEEAWLKLFGNDNFKIRSLRIFHHENTGTVKPLFSLRQNTLLEIEELEVRRTLNNGTVPMIKYFDAANNGVVIRNVKSSNTISDIDLTPVAYPFIDTNGNYSSQMTFDTFFTVAGTPTHKLHNVDGLILNNISGVISLNAGDGTIINNPITYPITAIGESATIEGLGSVFQELQKIASISGFIISMNNVATAIVPINLPADCQIIGVTLRVDALITGATSWDAAFSGGATDVIVAGAAVAKNTKVNKMYATPPIPTSGTNVTFTAVGGNFTAGDISFVVRYRQITSLPNVP